MFSFSFFLPLSKQKLKVMKKIILLSLAVFSLMFISCTTEKEDPNPYNGTKWTKTYDSSYGDSYMYVLEFTNTEFSYYRADINGGYQSGMSSGPYTYNGNTITINNVRNNASPLDEYFTGATVSGNMITLKSYWISSKGERFDDEMTLMKR